MLRKNLEDNKKNDNLALLITTKTKHMANEQAKAPKATKSAKQEFLDRPTKEVDDMVVERLITTLTKTKIAAIGRSLNELKKVAYRTHEQELPFAVMLEAVERAYKLQMSEKETDNAGL